MIEFLLHAPSRDIFVAVMAALKNPVTGTSLAWIDPDTQMLVPSEGLHVDEVGVIWKVLPELDIDGYVVKDGEAISGHHVNLAAYGELERVLTAGCPTKGTIFERTNILSMLGTMHFEPITEEGIPEGYEGTSKVRLFDPSVVHSRSRVWA